LAPDATAPSGTSAAGRPKLSPYVACAWNLPTMDVAGVGDGVGAAAIDGGRLGAVDGPKLEAGIVDAADGVGNGIEDEGWPGASAEGDAREIGVPPDASDASEGAAAIAMLKPGSAAPTATVLTNKRVPTQAAKRIR